MDASDEITALLKRFKIRPTVCRAQLLSVVLEKNDGRFSNDDIALEIKNRQILMSKTAVANTLRLFCVRGIIQAIDPKRTAHRGRPELLYIISPKLNPPPSPYTISSPQFEEELLEYCLKLSASALYISEHNHVQI